MDEQAGCLIWSDAANLIVLLADGTAARDWRGRRAPAYAQTEDLPYIDEAGLRAAPLDVGSASGIAMNLHMGSGRARIFRLGEANIVLSEPVPDSDRLLESDEYRVWATSARSDFVSIGKIKVDSGVIFVGPCQRDCSDIAELTGPSVETPLIQQERLKFGGGGALVAVRPGAYDVRIEPIDWDHMPELGRRCELIRSA